jgi:hypothetical protein
MLLERQLERSWVLATLKAPEAVEQDPIRPGVMRAFRRIPERGGRIMRVAYVDAGDSIRILTVFLDRRRRRRT